MFLTATKANNCVTKMQTITFLHQNFFLNAIRFKQYVMKLLILVLLQYNLFLNDIRLKKCFIKQIKDVLFSVSVFFSIPDQYKTQEICEIFISLYHFCQFIALINIKLRECVIELSLKTSLASLKIIPDCFVTGKMFKKNYIALYEDDGLHFFDDSLVM